LGVKTPGTVAVLFPVSHTRRLLLREAFRINNRLPLARSRHSEVYGFIDHYASLPERLQSDGVFPDHAERLLDPR